MNPHSSQAHLVQVFGRRFEEAQSGFNTLREMEANKWLLAQHPEANEAGGVGEMKDEDVNQRPKPTRGQSPGLFPQVRSQSPTPRALKPLTSGGAPAEHLKDMRNKNTSDDSAIPSGEADPGNHQGNQYVESDRPGNRPGFIGSGGAPTAEVTDVEVVKRDTSGLFFSNVLTVVGLAGEAEKPGSDRTKPEAVFTRENASFHLQNRAIEAAIAGLNLLNQILTGNISIKCNKFHDSLVSSPTRVICSGLLSQASNSRAITRWRSGTKRRLFSCTCGTM